MQAPRARIRIRRLMIGAAVVASILAAIAGRIVTPREAYSPRPGISSGANDES
jgi:hypothetical protein